MLLLAERKVTNISSNYFIAKQKGCEKCIPLNTLGGP